MASSSSSAKQQLDAYLATLYSEGILDKNFEQLQILQDSSPHFIDEILTMFINDTQRALDEATKYMSNPAVDLREMYEFSHQLKGSSSSVGAKLVKLACVSLRQASEANNYERSLEAFNNVKREYYNIRDKFLTIIQLDRSM